MKRYVVLFSVVIISLCLAGVALSAEKGLGLSPSVSGSQPPVQPACPEGYQKDPATQHCVRSQPVCAKGFHVEAGPCTSQQAPLCSYRCIPDFQRTPPIMITCRPGWTPMVSPCEIYCAPPK